jgi:hypothetical protein
LLHCPKFLDEIQQESLLFHCLKLHEYCSAQSATAESTAALQTAAIPQPDFVRSAQHNLGSEEQFIPLRVPDSSSEDQTELLRCEWFPAYGGGGHSLGYFRGNQHIPRVVRLEVLPLIAQHVAPVQQLLMAKAMLAQLQAKRPGQDDAVSELDAMALQWKMTLNTYAAGTRGEVPGFPYHVDIAANGPITMIATLRRGATLELLHKDAAEGAVPERVDLQPGSLVVLSGEARWEWRHRILPAPNEGDKEDVSRVSVVFGCM